MEADIFKDREYVATCGRTRILEMDFEGFPRLEMFHMPVVVLDRMRVFEHMSGKPLSSFFNQSGIKIGERRIEPVFYIHGRSESIRGKTTVTAVVLVHPHGPIDHTQLVLRTPEIYKQFTALL